MKKKRQKSAAPKRAAPVAALPTRGVASLDLHESIRSLVAGVITGIAVTVLYQNVTGHQAGGVAYSAAAAAESASLPPVARPPQAPASAAQDAGQAVSAKLMPGLGLPLPVLPPPKLTPIRLHESEPSGVQIKGINPAKERQAEQATEQEDDGSGVHVEIRSKKNPPPDVLPAQTPATSTTAAPASTASVSVAPPPEKTAVPDKPPQVSLKPLATKPLQLEPASDAPVVQEKLSPKFTVIERQADGELIRVGNQVRFIGAGASLPDGTKVSVGK